MHTVKGCSIVSEAEVDFFCFWNFLALSMTQRMLATWSVVPLPFINPAWTSGSYRFLEPPKMKYLSIKINSVIQSYPPLCNPLDCSLLDSSVHGILQAIILEWSGVPCPLQGDLSDPGIEPMSPALQADSLQSEPTGMPRDYLGEPQMLSQLSL